MTETKVAEESSMWTERREEFTLEKRARILFKGFRSTAFGEAVARKAVTPFLSLRQVRPKNAPEKAAVIPRMAPAPQGLVKGSMITLSPQAMIPITNMGFQ